MKKLRSADTGATLLSALAFIQRIALASALLWPVAMLLYVPAISRLVNIIVSLGARATIARERLRKREVPRSANAGGTSSRNFVWLRTGIGGLCALLAAA